MHVVNYSALSAGVAVLSRIDQHLLPIACDDRAADYLHVHNATVGQWFFQLRFLCKGCVPLQ
jgi:hypothetical protein